MKLENKTRELKMRLNDSMYAIALERIILIQNDALESIARINDCVGMNNIKISAQLEKYEKKLAQVFRQCGVI